MRTELYETQEKVKSFKAEIKSLKEKNDESTKDLKAKDIVFNSLATDNVLKEKKIEIEEMEKELIELEETWKEASEELNLNLARAKRQFDEKRVEIEQKQEKIDFYEDNYSKLVQDLKLEMQRRDALIKEYTSIPKDTKREELSIIVNETKTRCKTYEQTTSSKQQELKTMNNMIKRLEDDGKKLVDEITKKMTELEEKKKKDDKSFDKIKDVMDKLGKTHRDMKHYMERFVDLRLKNRQLQDRVQDLRRNKYQEISEKLRSDLKEISNSQT